MKNRKVITPKGYLKLKYAKMMLRLLCANCKQKVKEGWTSLTNQYGFIILCNDCYKKGFRIHQEFGVKRRYNVKQK